jgi:hypothetical protein
MNRKEHKKVDGIKEKKIKLTAVTIREHLWYCGAAMECRQLDLVKAGLTESSDTVNGHI